MTPLARGRPAGATLLIAALIGAVFLLPPRAAAAPCCMSATAFGMGRLAIWEDFALGLRTSLSPSLGAWDAAGHWSSYDDYADLEWRSELWALVAIDRRLSVFARLPAVATHRSAGALSDLGGGVGDLSFGGRYELLSIGEVAELPAIALTLSVLAPTGRATADAETPLGVDVTGRGAWVLSAGLSLEVTRLPWFVRLDLGLTVPLPARRDDLGLSQRLGPSFDLGLSGGVEVAPRVVVSLASHLMLSSDNILDGASVPHSDRFELGLGPALSWGFAWSWTLQAGLDTNLFAADLGRNVPGRVTTTLGLRYGSL